MSWHLTPAFSCSPLQNSLHLEKDASTAAAEKGIKEAAVLLRTTANHSRIRKCQQPSPPFLGQATGRGQGWMRHKFPVAEMKP